MKISCKAQPSQTTQIIFVTTPEAEKLVDFEGKKGTIAVRYVGKSTCIYACVGALADCTLATARTVAAKAVQRAADLKRTAISLCLPELLTNKDTGFEVAIIEGVLAGHYAYDRYKKEKNHRIGKLEIVGTTLSSGNLKQLETIADSVHWARNLINENADVVTPEYLAKEARSIAKTYGCTCTILDEKKIHAEKLGLLEAVGRGSPYPPRLILVEYTGNPRSKEKIALVGKGVTFDSGGVNLKPSGSVEDMRVDMAGAAAVLATITACAALKAKVNLVAVVPAAHNAIDGASYFPGDVYRSYNGTTVEITNTDAEGRLILADALSYCIEKCKPTQIIDLATLTGGVLTALGEYVAGLFSNNDALAQNLFNAGEISFERLWRFPLYSEYSESMKSDIADLRNTSKFKRGYASSITGACFIQEFVKDIPWAHIDIAGTATNDGECRGEIPKFATGFGVRLLMEYLLKSSRS